MARYRISPEEKTIRTGNKFISSKKNNMMGAMADISCFSGFFKNLIAYLTLLHLKVPPPLCRAEKEENATPRFLGRKEV